MSNPKYEQNNILGGSDVNPLYVSQGQQTTRQPARMVAMSGAFMSAKLSGSALLNLEGFHTVNGLRFVQVFFTGGLPGLAAVPMVSIPVSGAFTRFILDYGSFGGYNIGDGMFVGLSQASASYLAETGSTLCFTSIIRP